MILRQLCKEQRGVLEVAGECAEPFLSANVRIFRLTLKPL
jgi:hypothetical protein